MTEQHEPCPELIKARETIGQQSVALARAASEEQALKERLAEVTRDCQTAWVKANDAIANAAYAQGQVKDAIARAEHAEADAKEYRDALDSMRAERDRIKGEHVSMRYQRDYAQEQCERALKACNETRAARDRAVAELAIAQQENEGLRIARAAADIEPGTPVEVAPAGTVANLKKDLDGLRAKLAQEKDERIAAENRWAREGQKVECMRDELEHVRAVAVKRADLLDERDRQIAELLRDAGSTANKTTGTYSRDIVVIETGVPVDTLIAAIRGLPTAVRARTARGLASIALESATPDDLCILLGSAGAVHIAEALAIWPAESRRLVADRLRPFAGQLPADQLWAIAGALPLPSPDNLRSASLTIRRRYDGLYHMQRTVPRKDSVCVREDHAVSESLIGAVQSLERQIGN